MFVMDNRRTLYGCGGSFYPSITSIYLYTVVRLISHTRAGIKLTTGWHYASFDPETEKAGTETASCQK